MLKFLLKLGILNIYDFINYNFFKLNFNFLFFILFLFIIFKFFSNSIFYFFRKYKIYILLILLISFSFFSLYLNEIRHLMYLFEQKKFEEFFLILRKEFLSILVFYVISLLILILNFNKNFKLFLKSQIDFKSFLPLIFFLILFFFWFFNAPNPRLGQFLLFLFLPSIVFIFVQYQNIKLSKYTFNLIYISIIFLIINTSLFNNLKKIQFKDIFALGCVIPETDVLVAPSITRKAGD